jgi:hypothetical protein
MAYEWDACLNIYEDPLPTMISKQASLEQHLQNSVKVTDTLFGKKILTFCIKQINRGQQRDIRSVAKQLKNVSPLSEERKTFSYRSAKIREN